MVANSLKTWFIIHFVADYLAAIPLMLAPQFVLSTLQWPVFDPVAVRIIAAAFMAIGGTSLLERNASADVYRALLKLKLIWSVMAMVGILLANRGQFALGDSVVFAVFVVFFCVWAYYYRQLRQSSIPKPQV